MEKILVAGSPLIILMSKAIHILRKIMRPSCITRREEPSISINPSFSISANLTTTSGISSTYSFNGLLLSSDALMKIELCKHIVQQEKEMTFQVFKNNLRGIIMVREMKKLIFIYWQSYFLSDHLILILFLKDHFLSVLCTH